MAYIKIFDMLQMSILNFTCAIEITDDTLKVDRNVLLCKPTLDIFLQLLGDQMCFTKRTGGPYNIIQTDQQNRGPLCTNMRT